MKVRVLTEERTTTPLDNNPLYVEGVHMLNGLEDDEMYSFLDEHPMIVPLFDIDVLSSVELYIASTANQDAPHEPVPESVKELQHTRDALDWESTIYQRVKASTMEEVILGSATKPHTLKIAKDLATDERSVLLGLLTKY